MVIFIKYMFLQISGPLKFTDPIPKSTGVAFTANSVMTTTTGKLTTAGNTELGLLGIMPREVTSSDSDYNDATPVQLIRFHDEAEYEVDVQGTATEAMVGEAHDLYSSTGLKLDIGNNSYKQFVITRFISASKVVVKPNFAVITP